ncbi:MAG: Clp protease N-terminal domain-containing protein [Anaerolineae bacterium]|nr:Clp protease N-terminal domain-containing protein [Anaerolineae bacterium]MDQ7035795.1 Clp protease N-terminal domain-containing protein [Anaerolineae bacterium]
MALHHRYSHHVHRALQHAGLLARDYGHPRQDTAHLLVGVMLTEGSLGAQVMEIFDLPVPVAKVYLKRLMPPSESNSGSIPLDESFDKALEQAADEASWLDSHYIGTEHLLLGITRTNLGNAMNLLRLVGITPEQLRRRLRHVISDGNVEFSLETVRANARLSELSRRVLNAAEQLAVSLDHPTVGMGHLIMALSNERRGVSSKFLKQSGLDADQLKQALNVRNRQLFVEIEIVLDEAITQAEKLGSHYVGADHLLFSLTLLDKGAELLQAYGASSDKIRRLLQKHLA